MKQALNDLTVVISNIVNPYENLSLEKFLLEGVSPGEVFLYLWQNEKTVVCGRNQNVWKECRVDKLKADKGFAARRLSGGGAVFHDLGNLNFTFIACEADYDLEKQLQVIISAAESFGIEAVRSGRNDITAYGAKFSGNAFYKTNPLKFEDGLVRRYHHGTLMIDVDKNMLSAYLNVDKEKYESKGVDSVKSRVCNLKDLNPDITVEAMTKAMTEAFERIYGKKALVYEYGKSISGGLQMELSDEDKKKIAEDAAFFASDEWLFKNNIKFNVRFQKRFDFGELDLRLFADKGVIKNAALYSDAMDEQSVLEMAARIEKLSGADYSFEAIKAAIGDDKIAKELLN